MGIIKRKENKNKRKKENSLRSKEQSERGREDIKLEIVDIKLLDIYPKENFSIWKINAWNKSDVSNRVRTIYLSLSAEESLDKIIAQNKKAFLIGFEVLVSNLNEDYMYVGNITKRNDTIIATAPNSIKSIHWLDRVDRCIKEDMENIEQQKSREVKIEERSDKQKKDKTR